MIRATRTCAVYSESEYNLIFNRKNNVYYNICNVQYSCISPVKYSNNIAIQYILGTYVEVSKKVIAAQVTTIRRLVVVYVLYTVYFTSGLHNNIIQKSIYHKLIGIYNTINYYLLYEVPTLYVSQTSKQSILVIYTW